MTSDARREPAHEMLGLMTARVRDAYLRPPLWLDAGLDLAAACRAMAEHGTTHALVRDAERLGIFTTTDLRDAVVAGGDVHAMPLRDAARFDLVEIEADAEVFEALWLMVRARVHRVVVRDAGQVIGVLGQLDLLSFVARHSHVMALQIDQAATVEDLSTAARGINDSVAALHASGVSVDRIARLTSEMNRRLVQRLWSLLAPADLQANSCLLVMGSEGRGEQILKTDQDNALLLRDGFASQDLEAVAQRLSQALASFGYPPCPGGIMVSNPAWRLSESDFRAAIAHWLHGGDPDGPMRLAIVLDAEPVAGDAALHQRLRQWLAGTISDHQGFLARFAAAADQFTDPTPWWRRWWPREDGIAIDLKKHGIFPIVHGVRALALQYGVLERSTASRLDALVCSGHFESKSAAELVDALHSLMALRLANQLRGRASHRPPDNLIDPRELPPRDRDALHHALVTVRSFRARLRRHFGLDSL